jgi:hypothetical protein
LPIEAQAGALAVDDPARSLERRGAGLEGRSREAITKKWGISLATGDRELNVQVVVMGVSASIFIRGAPRRPDRPVPDDALNPHLLGVLHEVVREWVSELIISFTLIERDKDVERSPYHINQN